MPGLVVSTDKDKVEYAWESTIIITAKNNLNQFVGPGEESPFLLVETMPVEKSAGALVFRKEGGQIHFLLLHYPSSTKSGDNYWEFPKGHIEKGEDKIETVKREVREETGLGDLKFIEGFKETIKYFFKFQDQNVLKFTTFYLIKTNQKEVRVSSEHLGFAWLPLAEARARLKFKNSKGILERANHFLDRVN